MRCPLSIDWYFPQWREHEARLVFSPQHLIFKTPQVSIHTQLLVHSRCPKFASTEQSSSHKLKPGRDKFNTPTERPGTRRASILGIDEDQTGWLSSSGRDSVGYATLQLTHFPPASEPTKQSAEFEAGISPACTPHFKTRGASTAPRPIATSGHGQSRLKISRLRLVFQSQCVFYRAN